ncbi:hypothetical protein SCLCIDRAFT_286314 [Scleroderma citrinum Foug A]|uniref:Uncharacterized protein n=1 Tax=Scleroderma citrinum Foug A TaxID=1036808 RepID=A0A0C3DHD0_9AGAM|nr:hypothetical protein SCLCIDRAFT_286314 [Scleroderma citrinum Foug A]
MLFMRLRASVARQVWFPAVVVHRWWLLHAGPLASFVLTTPVHFHPVNHTVHRFDLFLTSAYHSGTLSPSLIVPWSSAYPRVATIVIHILLAQEIYELYILLREAISALWAIDAITWRSELHRPRRLLGILSTFFS